MPHEHLSTHSATGSGMTLLLLAVVACAGSYLVASSREHRRGRHWSRWRTASFLLGAAMVVASLAPPLSGLAHHDLRVHMVQHLLLGMLGPIGLVLGTPVTLALRSLPTTVARRIVRALHSRPIAFASHPVTALVLNVGAMGALYLTPLYALMGEHPAVHAFVHVHFLAAGCLFSWAVLQLEPAGPVRMSPPARLLVLFVAIAAHATIAKAMYAFGFPRGTPHALVEIEQAAKIMYYGGDVSELVLMVVLFANWRPRKRQQARTESSP